MDKRNINEHIGKMCQEYPGFKHFFICENSESIQNA